MKHYKRLTTCPLVALILVLITGGRPTGEAIAASAPATRPMALSNPRIGLTAASTLSTYVDPQDLWSVPYPANLLHVEHLNEDVVIFISKDRHMFAAVDTYMATFDEFRKTGSDLRRRAAETLALIYGKPVQVTGAVESSTIPWETGITFTTQKGSTGTAIYGQRGRSQENYRVYGFLFGYKTSAEAAMLPILLEMRASFLNTAPQYKQDLERARDALVSYFALLHEGRYSDAVQLYGGSYDDLHEWRPKINPFDHAELFQSVCASLLQCHPIKTVVYEEVVNPSEFAFVVEFTDEYGGVFEMGPCCGATQAQMPTETRFSYTVKKVNNRFLVQDLPLYVP